MTSALLLDYLRLRGVRLWAEGERLRYSAPPGVLTPDVRDQLAAHKRELIALLGQAAPDLRPVARDRPLPLSFAQQRLWSFDQLAPGDPVYNASVGLRMDGALDVAALGRALDEMLRRHETLRTTFAVRDRRPFQVIAPPARLPLPLLDLRALPAAGREAAALGIMAGAARIPFDLARDRPLRATLLRLDDHAHLLLLLMHHIAADGWSMGVLVQECVSLYAAFAEGRPDPLPDLPIQYADYAIWQRAQIQGPALDRQLEYWKRQLADLPTLDLPTDRPRPPVATFRGSRRALHLAPDLSDALRAISARAGSTLFMTLLAAFLVVLRYLTRQDDLVVGTDVSGRNRREIEGLIGFFSNQLVLRADLSGAPSFEDLTGRVRAMALDAFANQDAPFERLAAFGPARDASRTPLFQVKFVLQNAPLPLSPPRGLALSPLDIDNGTTKFDLLVNMRDFERSLSGLFEYNADLFDDASIERIAGRYHALLEAVAARPDAPLSELDQLLAEADREREQARARDLQSVRLQKLAGLNRRRAEKEPQT